LLDRDGSPTKSRSTCSQKLECDRHNPRLLAHGGSLSPARCLAKLCASMSSGGVRALRQRSCESGPPLLAKATKQTTQLAWGGEGLPGPCTKIVAPCKAGARENNPLFRGWSVWVLFPFSSARPSCPLAGQGSFLPPRRKVSGRPSTSGGLPEQTRTVPVTVHPPLGGSGADLKRSGIDRLHAGYWSSPTKVARTGRWSEAKPQLGKAST